MIVGQALWPVGPGTQAFRFVSLDLSLSEPTELRGQAARDPTRPDQARLGALGEFLQIHFMPEVLS